MAALVVVVFALEREAAPFRKLVRRERLPVQILISGIRARNFRQSLDSIPDARLVISAGFCGALHPALRVGDVCQSDDALILTVDDLIASPLEKRRLHEATGADVVDMEAEIVRRECQSRGIRFLAVKAVSDDAHSSLAPDLEQVIVDGRVSILNVLIGIVRRPMIVRDFMQLSRNTSLAAERLAEQIQRIVRKFLVSG